MSRAASLQFLVALAFAACQSGSAEASDTGSDCLIHHDGASAIACYRQITEGMKEDTSWCQGCGLKAVQELQANISKSLMMWTPPPNGGAMVPIRLPNQREERAQ